MLLYYISDRKSFSGSDAEQREAVIRRIAEAAHAGVDYIQLREKDLSACELERLVRAAVAAVRDNSSSTKLLINGRTDIALAAGADGVHLPGGEISPGDVRVLWMKCSDRPPLIGVSAHSIAEVRLAESHGANFAVLAPVFEKVQTSAKGIGLEALREACAEGVAASNVEGVGTSCFAVLALGGVNLENAGACLDAGAAGVAAIRLFQAGDIDETVRRLRALVSGPRPVRSAEPFSQ